MNVTKLDIRDNKVQRFLWDHLVPTDLRHDYTLLDAMKEVERQVSCGDCQLWGDMDEGIALRIMMRNPKVAEPHIMGDGLKLRTLFREAIAMGWDKGIKKVCVYTQFERIASICQRLGFTHEATLKGMHMGEGGILLDLFVMTMENPDAI